MTGCYKKRQPLSDFERRKGMSNGGPKAPKDPTKKRPGFYVLYEKAVEAGANADGSGTHPVYLNDGRLLSAAKVVGKITDEETMELLKTTEGFKRLVHSIGVSVTCDNPDRETEFAFQMYGKKDLYGGGTTIQRTFPANGSENVIELSEVEKWSEDDDIPGQFRFSFQQAGEVAVVSVKFYLNEGYSAPDFIPDAPVDFESAAYRTMLAKSFVSLGNNVRLKRAIDKAKAGEDVTVAFIGGSITQGAGAVPIQQSCYAKLAYDAFCRRFAKNGNVHYTKAGVGGTPSELGMIRYERDILGSGAAPDVVVVEFAVNDEGDETKGDCYESLVRNILFSENAPAVILLFSVFENDWNLQERLMPVGVRYDLPMVSIRNAVVDQFYLTAEKGRVISKNRFFYDMFHPTNEGHRIMADSLDYLFGQSDAGAVLEEPDYAALEPVYAPEFKNIHLLDRKENKIGAVISCGGFTAVDRVLQYVEMNLDKETTPEFPNNWMCLPDSGEEPFVLKIKSPYLLMVSKDSGDNAFGKADVYVDGEFVFTADPHGNGWDHCNAQIVYRGKENVEHTVEIRRNSETPDTQFTILGFGYMSE